MPFKVPKEWDTHAQVQGVEQEVLVHFFYQPEERDTNTGESVTVESCWFEDQGDVFDDMTETEQADLEQRVLERIHEQAQAYYEGDG